MGWGVVELMEMKPTSEGLRAAGRWPLDDGWKKLESREEAEERASSFRCPTRVVETGSGPPAAGR